MEYLQHNLERLRSRCPALVMAVRESAGNVLTVTPSREGAPSATYQGQWVHSAYDPRTEARSWAEQQVGEWKRGELGVVLGVGLLYHIEALAQVNPDHCRLAVVVPDPSVLKDALGARPLGPWLNTIIWVMGTAQEMAEQLASHATPLRFFTYGPAARVHAEEHQRLEASLRRIVAAQAGGRLHVAVVGPIYGGSLPIARYAVRALGELGHRVTYIDHSVHHASYQAFDSYRDERSRLTVQSRFADVLSLSTMATIAEDPPDLVLAIAQAPLSLAVLQHLQKKKFLTAMWFVENFRHLTYWQQLAAGYEYWFVIQQTECIDALKRAGATEVHYLPMAADPVVHRPITLTADEQQEYGADVSFVGAGYANRRRLLPQWLSKEWSFKLWGNEWDGAADLSSVLQRNGARIDTDTCMKVFNATAINLNLHSSSGMGLDAHPDFVNPRTFELAACGAFQLVDERTLLSDLFSSEEMVCFRSPDEVPSLIQTWLKDSAGRRAYAEAAQRRVLREHTYRHRMQDLLAAVGLHQPDRIGSILRGERSATALQRRTDSATELSPLLSRFPPGQRVELKDLAADIQARAPGRELSREELLVLMLDSYRAETRDLL
ncbi:MAG: glycosyltransferase [Nitrospira sp.]|nr:glycosyltransferase [Nitrospira sp.]MDH4245405.1 glycosyltransferase [Nitrospira sp.]